MASSESLPKASNNLVYRGVSRISQVLSFRPLRGLLNSLIRLGYNRFAAFAIEVGEADD